MSVAIGSNSAQATPKAGDEHYECPPGHKHDKAGTCYAHHKCRCDPCCERKSKYMAYCEARKRSRGSQFVPAKGTIRRIQALKAIGWTAAEIGSHASMTANQVANIINRPNTMRVTMRTAFRIDKAYRELSMSHGDRPPERTNGTQYAPPLAWDDIDRDLRPKGKATK